MKAVKMNEVRRGEFFRLKESETAPVWVKGYYYRPAMVYEAYKYEDTNKETFIKGSRIVFIDFEY